MSTSHPLKTGRAALVSGAALPVFFHVILAVAIPPGPRRSTAAPWSGPSASLLRSRTCWTHRGVPAGRQRWLSFLDLFRLDIPCCSRAEGGDLRFTPCSLQDYLKALSDIAGVDGLPRLGAGGEYPFREDTFFVLRQQLHHGGQQDNGAVGCFGLWFTEKTTKEEPSASRRRLLLLATAVQGCGDYTASYGYRYNLPLFPMPSDFSPDSRTT